MSIFSVISLLGGLALFLYGMSVLSSSLEKVSEGRLEGILERLSGSLPRAVLLGAMVTAAIQSSSAATVVVVGLVNAKALRLRQAIGIIMGANIGTTVTAQILRLSDINDSNIFLNLIKPSTLAPMIAAVGIVCYMAGKKDRVRELGQIMLGFGVLFSGMFQMESAMSPLSEMPGFEQLFATMSNPIIGVLVGAGVTALLQSSSASIGILQALSSTGAISCASAFPIILGQNIGTCVTPILAGMGAGRNAKRASIVHLCFNIAGTAVFLVGLYVINAVVGFSFWNSAITKGGIANFHTLFNVTATLLLMPFAGRLEKLVYRVIPAAEEENELADIAATLDERLLVSPGLAIEHGRAAVLRMSTLALESFALARELLTTGYEAKKADKLERNEQMIDTLQDKIEDYAIKISRRHITERNKAEVSELLHMIGELERIGDQCENLMETAQSSGGGFSSKADLELVNICNAVDEILTAAIDAYRDGDIRPAHRVEPLEQVIDIMEEQYKANHISRMQEGECSVQGGFAFVESLAALERIADHCSNIAVFLITVKERGGGYDTHAYLHALHKGQSQEYTGWYNHYSEKYL